MTTTDLASVRARLVQCRDAMCAAYIERDDCVDALLLGALAQEHVLLLGPPGTGKSHVVSGLMACFAQASTFDWLLTKFTTPEEILGPLDITKLKAGVSERNPANKLPVADVAFLDETFKANSAILNSLLRMMNERKWDQGKVPLRLLCGASNEMPEDESLAAMFDRFLVRHTVEYIRADANRVKFQRAKASGQLRAFVPPATITVAEWDAARADVDGVNVPDAIVNMVVKLQSQLADKGIIISDRRIGQCYGLLKAAAWLDGATAVEPDHLNALRFALWAKQEDIAQVKSLLDQIDMGPAREALRIIDDAMRVYEQRPQDPALFYEEIPRLIQTLKDAAHRVAEYKGTVSKRAGAKIQRELTAMKAARDDMMAQLTRRLEG
jgi:MoxR-like ATPase